ncbi:MAG: FAD-dependent oxidoreductase, partial [Desulfobulbaceae bacterium]|nr:FAD-dependent oxidoreductase [Desulfobulbaceae bacterium]
MNSIKTDFLVIGAGIIGLTLALRIKNKHPDCSLTLIEKEKDCGIHASGRNSGILHAGFYYTADSLKARFTRQGNKLLKEYCGKRKLRINSCGKLVVAKNDSELPVLDELLLRAKLNGVELHEITADEAKKIEPRVKTFKRALFSPSTSSVNPQEVVASLVTDARKAGVVILADTAYLKHDNNDIVTTKGNISAGYIINTAGLYADKIARDFGFSKNFFILPFKGLFLMADNAAGKIHTNIYPVPDLKNPFL